MINHADKLLDGASGNETADAGERGEIANMIAPEGDTDTVSLAPGEEAVIADEFAKLAVRLGIDEQQQSRRDVISHLNRSFSLFMAAVVCVRSEAGIREE